MSFDGQRAAGQIPAEPAQVCQVLGVGRELKDVDIVGSVLWVCPSQDGIGGSVQNVFGVGPSQVRGKRDVERVVYRGVGGGRR